MEMEFSNIVIVGLTGVFMLSLFSIPLIYNWYYPAETYYDTIEIKAQGFEDGELLLLDTHNNYYSLSAKNITWKQALSIDAGTKLNVVVSERALGDKTILNLVIL